MLDIHSHHTPPYPEGVINIRSGTIPASMAPEQPLSVGIHPWDTTDEITGEQWEIFESTAALPQVVAIGECGFDTLKGGPMFRQINVFKRQAELAERLRKPLVIHAVKAADIILGLKRDLNPSQPWIIHGFRGKPALARQMIDRGLYLSFGERFNADALNATPSDRLLAETDESTLSIHEIIARLSAARGEDLIHAIANNTANLIGV